MASRLLKVTVTKWADYNARADRANYTWFRFQNDFFTNQKLFGLSDAQIILYQMIVCEASKKNSGEVDISLDYLATIRKTNLSKIEGDLAELVSRGVLAVDQSHQLVESLPATYVRTNEQYERTNTIAQSSDFAAFWNEVPRKIGKDKTKKAYDRIIKSGVSHDQLTLALRRYKSHLKTEGTESKYIKHASTWINSWKDWDDPDAGKSEDFSQGPIGRGIAEILADEAKRGGAA